MRIAIYGVGGIGGYFGGRLAQAGHEVVFIARGATLEALRRQGLRLESPKGDLHLPQVAASDDPVAVGPVDLVMVAVKAWQVAEVAEKIRPLLGPRTVVLPLQNGVEAPYQLAETLGRERVLGGLAKIISYIVAPGHIRHLGAEPYIALGELDNRPSERAERIRATLEEAGIVARIPQDIVAALWLKFLFVAAWGGVGAATRAPVGVLRRLPETRELLEQAMSEIATLAAARGVSLPADAVASSMNFVDALPDDSTTSLQRDITEGRPSELEAWSGAVVHLGREAGVATPVNGTLYRCLLPLELRARGQLGF
ncbi:MAG TPA: 2-dehydropantoate 2-reductase [Candidatus Competibacteraceae bacterium]|nr:2-dehydropantoate 2-reductase [Candidatus Competibacteraceae bacterium]